MDYSVLISYLTSLAGNTSSSNSKNTKAYDDNTYAGWGANQYMSSVFSNTGTIKYTKAANSADTSIFKSADSDKTFSIESALAYSELGLQSADGKVGNSDGKVSYKEFKKSTGFSGDIAATVDTDGDEVISRAELTAYYMYADELDGKQDGKIKKSGREEFQNAVDDDADEVKTKLTAYKAQIAEADANFKLDAPVIDGTNEDAQTYEVDGDDDYNAIAANAGAEAGSLMGTNKLKFSDLKFGYGETQDEKMESGIAFATALLGGQSRVLASQCKLTVANLNGDAYISADEVLATMMYEDKDGDGKVSYKERLAFEQEVKSGSVEVEDIGDNVEEYTNGEYDADDLADTAEDYDASDLERVESDENTNTNNDSTALLITLLKSLFGLK